MKTFKTSIITIVGLLAFQGTNAESDKSERTISIKIQIIKVKRCVFYLNSVLKMLRYRLLV